MRKSVVPWLVVILVLLPLATACRQQSSAPDLSQSSAEESADLQERGNGTVELVTPRHTSKPGRYVPRALYNL